MTNLKLLLVFVVGFCCVAATLSASMNYEEPPMEAVSDDDGEGSSVEIGDDGSGDEDTDGSGDEVEGSGEGDESSGEDEQENGSGEEEEGSGDEEETTSEDEETEEEMDEMKSDDDKKDKKDKMEDDKEMSVVENASCPAKKSKDCGVTETLKIVVTIMKLLKEEVAELKEQVKKSCNAPPVEDASDASSEGKEGSGDDMEGSADGDGSGDDEDEDMDEEVIDDEKDDMKDEKEDMDDEKDDMDDDKDEMDDEKEDMDKTTTSTTTLPPPPERCPPPFQLLANSCYYIQTDSREWRSWGDANAFCQEQGGALAAPYRPGELMEYLHQSYSGAIWVGGKMTDGKLQWLNGREIAPKEWRGGKPNPHPARKCVLLDSRDRYLATNFFCGEKFSFICEHIGVEEPSQNYYK